ncbi:Phosphoenolpyruvate-protein kinase (PTS system EI component) [Sulfobacillus thermosulfidooxidans DSM 9293]|uniref:Phosphoenolpyruvate-protein kinase (PTS system EI component) n=1 Tax=Sulfobacillus thermosulfidooxidans (strain DSM 9293 / VKM B-1269 / AT-1) TaxID=929705 RepID=A0A1W1WD32_SULTA|nr:putative PEP-binding protein [Sulfobacillus thermosulfidooxidans]SMC04079.1 Phosphoenolpyruvate-protein kinase (PTS system EI component) [Sulfobacillus thermosulfidooxidans DSM 9293]
MRYHAEVLSSGVTQGPWMFVLDTVEESQASTSSDWKKAHARAIATLEELSTTIAQTHEKDIIEAQILMLQDPTWLSRVEELSRTFDPKTAIWQSAEEFASSLDQIADPYLQQRAQDIRDVAVLWIQSLTNHQTVSIEPQTIVVTDKITVQDVLSWAQVPVLGIIVEEGSALMHASLIAQNMGIPVVKLPSAIKILSRQSMHPQILLNADEGYIELFDESSTGPKEDPHQNSPTPLYIGPVIIQGQSFEIMANVSSVLEVNRARDYGADGIGLVRTEFFFEAADHLLSLDEQVDLYRLVLKNSPGPVIFRTIDIGSDKPLAFLPLKPEANPALGQRGVRIYSQYPELLKTQLQAMLRAQDGEQPVSIMFPMISTLEEWQFCWNMAHEVINACNRPVSSMRLGIMLEVPSLLFLIPELAQHHVQFASLGSNDLYQYVLAKGREQSTDHSSSGAFSFARAVAYASVKAQAHNLPLSVCGQLAQEPRWALLFAGLHMTRLSMASPQIPHIKAYLRDHMANLSVLESQVKDALSSLSSFTTWMTS